LIATGSAAVVGGAIAGVIISDIGEEPQDVFTPETAATTIITAATTTIPTETTTIPTTTSEYTTEQPETSDTETVSPETPTEPTEITTLEPTTRETTTTAPQVATSPPESTTQSSPQTQPPQSSVNIGEVIQFGGYDWRVLDVQDGRALILSDRAVILQQYHSDRNEIVTWENSDIRAWLNGDFYNETFSANEMNRISETQDRIFLLNTLQVERYRANINTTSWWWTRSPGNGTNRTALVRANGSIDYAGNHVDNRNGGIRPALWLIL
jgi:hypothetical protein